MKNLSFVALAAAVLMPANAYGLQINTTAGALPGLVKDSDAITELTITGSVDASDLFFIDDRLKNLKVLDLSGAKIESYSGDKLRGISTFPANFIPVGTFAGSSISEIKLPVTDGLSIGDMAFSATLVESIVIPGNVVSIGIGAFSNCTKLKTLDIADTAVGAYAFKGCRELTAVNFGGTALSESIFAECISLEDFNARNSISFIPAKAFQGCVSLKHFGFSSDVRYIGESSFYNSGLESLQVENTSLDSIGPWAFANSSLEIVQLPNTLKHIGDGAFFECSKLHKFYIPESCTSVADYVFKDVKNSDTILVLPQGITSVGKYAFKGMNGVNHVTFPQTLSYLDDGAMENMENLSEIEASGLSSVPRLGKDVWAGIDPSKVRLNVDEKLEDDFKAAPQWQDFDIYSDLTGVEENVAKKENTLQARFKDNILSVRTYGEKLTRIEIFNPAGMLLMAVGVQGEEANIDTEALQGHMFIVVCRLEGSSAATLKLLR